MESIKTIQDKKSGGWIAFRDDKAVIGQGETRNEAIKSLKRHIKAIYKQ